MKGTLKIIKNGLLMAGIFVLAISAHHAYAQDTSPGKILDVSQYKTQKEFDGAIQTYFQKGGRVDNLLKALNRDWKQYPDVKNIYAKSDTGFSRYLEHNLFNKHAFEKIIDIGNGNKNVWRILIVENFYFFKRYQTQLIFEDEDFAKRGIPFQFIYFDDVSEQSDERVVRALESLVKNNRTPEEVVKIITSAGAKYSGSYKHTDGQIRKDVYEYIPNYRVLGKYVLPWAVGIGYMDDHNNKLEEFTIGAGAPKLNIVMP